MLVLRENLGRRAREPCGAETDWACQRFTDQESGENAWAGRRRSAAGAKSFAVRSGSTAQRKPGMEERYEVLDGLRGTAAFAVVLLHVAQTFFATGTNPLHHAYLAVDFFYMLSGFVIGHAYDDRWGRMGIADFFGKRLRRLHPMVVLGVTLGLAAYVLDPFAPAQKTAAPWLVGVVYVLGLLLVPAPSLPNRPGATHALNGPAWSLTQEYIANIVYALALRRASRRVLAGLVAASAIVLVAIGASQGTLQVGWGWDTLYLSPLRTAFPFMAGLLLQRCAARAPGRIGWVGLSLILAAAFLAPSPSWGLANGLLEAAIVIVLFPLVIAAGAAAKARGPLLRLCRLCGELSYPVYIVHWPIVRVYADWVWTRHPPRAEALLVGAAVLAAVPLLGWAALKLYDEPLRAWLGRRSGARRPASALAGEAPLI